MNIILAITILFGSLQFDGDSSLVQQSKEQAVYYMQQLNRNVEQEVHLWGLAELYQSHPEVRSFIKEEIQEKEYTQPYYRPFIKTQKSKASLLHDIVFTTGSPALFINLLLEEPNPDLRLQLKESFKKNFDFPVQNGIAYEAIADHLIQEKTIDKNLIQNDSFDLLHLLLFSDAKAHTLLTNQYYSETIKNWNPETPNKKSLLHSLEQASYFRSLYILDQYDDTKQFYSLLTEDNLFPNSELKYRIYRYLDYSMYRLGYFDLSLEVSKMHALPLTRYLRDKRSELSAMMAQAAYLLKIGKIKEAQRINLKILQESEDYEISVPRSTLQNNLSLTYKKSGQFDQYLDLQLKALEEANELDKYSHQLTILTNLYLYFQETKDKNSALLYLDEAENLAEEQNNIEHLGRINIAKGVLYRDFDKDYEKALTYFNRAKEILNQDNNFNYYAQLLDEEASLYREMDRYDLSHKIYNEIARLSKSRDQYKFLEAKLQLIDLNLKSKQLEKARELLTELKSQDVSQLNFENIIKLKTVEAKLLKRDERLHRAYEIMKPTIDQIVERAKNSTALQSGFWSIASQYIDAFEVTADLLIETGRHEEAVEVLDKLKTINDASLYQNPMVKSSLLDERELTQYQRLVGQLDALRKNQLMASEKEKLGLQNRIDQLSAQKRMLDRKISDMVDQKSISLGDVQRRLGGREMVLHITELNDWFYMAKISRNEVEFDKIRLDATLRSQFTRAVENLATGKTDMGELSRISSLLGLGNLPSWVNTLTVIPDSYLYQLPLDILPLQNNGYAYSYGEATYVVEKFKTHYLTSLRDFIPKEKTEKDYTWDFVGYGVSDFKSFKDKKSLVPLPHAAGEVSNIIGNLSNISEKTAYLDTASSEATFKETASNARIIHLATHSELSQRDPLFSTIYMNPETTPSNNDDFSGQIFAYELFELNLANDLIMLNSCESGSGSYLQGSGVMGISRALRYAGASSLVLNLWSVNDKMASDFAIEFYKNINQGQPKDEALRQAKLYFLKNKNANPHYWGPYMLIGDREPLVEPNRATNIYFAASFMLFFITIASFSLLKDWKNKVA